MRAHVIARLICHDGRALLTIRITVATTSVLMPEERA
jgi:hypothetical protein